MCQQSECFKKSLRKTECHEVTGDLTRPKAQIHQELRIEQMETLFERAMNVDLKMQASRRQLKEMRMFYLFIP